MRRTWRSKIIFEDEFGRGLIYLYSRDISLGGLFLENPPPLKMGAQLLLSILLPGRRRPLKVTGQVVRFVEHEMGARVRCGLGVRFVDMDPEVLKHLSSFVNS
ncbi:MAG: PilZ domain-containing protein [Deltaproteobacteria bacterium]|nr:PilZ domain-containing protein [Deltaproteobacteria bacterium]